MTRLLSLLLLTALLAGCPFTDSAIERVGDGLSRGIMNNDDPKTVRLGLPAYLLTVDGLIESYPENPPLLMSGAKIYSAYAANFVEPGPRQKRLAVKGRDYARRALCLELDDVCGALDGSLDDFKAELAGLDEDDLPVLYSYTSAWAIWIQSHSDDWNAIADVPKLEAAMERVLALDEGYDMGNVHVYLGVLATQLPEQYGGKPEEGRLHFERAIDLSQGRNLMAKTLYAEHYARMVFNRGLHDTLLRDVVKADPRHPGLTLSNVLAQERAEELLASSDDYF